MHKTHMRARMHVHITTCTGAHVPMRGLYHVAVDLEAARVRVGPKPVDPVRGIRLAGLDVQAVRGRVIGILAIVLRWRWRARWQRWRAGWYRRRWS